MICKNCEEKFKRHINSCNVCGDRYEEKFCDNCSIGVCLECSNYNFIELGVENANP